MQSQPTAPRSRALFVVGAGRSGTSVLTRGLLALGVDLGDRLKAPTEKNPTGFFEDVDLLRLAKRVRSRLGLRTESVSLIDDASWQHPDLENVRRETVETIRRRFADKPLWGFKYAQTLRMLPFWESVFEEAGIDVSYVVAARNPLSVARSRAKLDPLRGIQEKSDSEWLVNVVPYFRRLARRPFVVVDYDLLMAEPAHQLTRIARVLELPLTDETRRAVDAFAGSFLDSGMRHTSFDDSDLEKNDRLHPLTRDAYRWLRRLATDEVDRDSVELWEDWGRIERELQGLAPSLRHIDHLEAELRRSLSRPGQRALRWLRRRLPGARS